MSEKDFEEEFEREDEEQDEALSYEALKSLSPLDWARYGAREIAYFRPVVANGAPAVAIHAADGTMIGAAPNAALAAAAIRQHSMLPASVH